MIAFTYILANIVALAAPWMGRASTNNQHDTNMQIAEQQVERKAKEIKLTQKQEGLFWSKVDNCSAPNGCWLWVASTSKGYGDFRVGGKTLKAHRVAWSMAHGQIPHDGGTHGICVCHNCDNPLCCNPAHLFLGTNADNMRDKKEKGRQAHGHTHGSKTMPERLARGVKNGAFTHPERLARGERQGLAKLTEDIVRAIRARRASGEMGTALAREFGVNKQVIWAVVQRKTWRHVA